MKSDDFDMNWKVFNDAIHGHMSFHPLIVYIIDTPQVQRLRNLKQLGVSYFVFPTANHSRFEHSLGTCYLAGKLMDALCHKRGEIGKLYSNDDELRKRETLSVQIAGLCHDLGHGPFSHLWEGFLLRCGIKWKHEQSSLEIFDCLLEEIVSDKEIPGREISIRQLFRRYGMDTHIPDIKNMIHSKGRVDSKRCYLYQIVSNKYNNIDVDKWDYLLRDSKMANIPINFNFDRLFEYCQVLETDEGNREICFRDKECSGLINMFVSRGVLHDQVYQHRVVRCIEEMTIDAFVLAKDRLNLTCTKPESLLRLTDHIYQKILYENFGSDPSMEMAKKILQRIEKRNLYTCIASSPIKNPAVITRIGEENFRRIIEAEFSAVVQAVEEREINKSLIKCLVISIDMTKANKDAPLKNVMVYKKFDHQLKEHVPEPFDWKSFHNLMPDLKALKRCEVMMLYKGDNRFEFCENMYNQSLKEVLENLESGS